MAQAKPTTGKYWNDQTVAQPTTPQGTTPEPEAGAQVKNFGTSDRDADRRPTLLDKHGHVISGDPQ
jgi:hypothetical protein